VKRSRLRFLGFIGLLGLLSLVTSNPGFAGFFGFFGFFAFWNFVDDERFQANTGRSARNAFVSALVVYPAILVYGVLVPSVTALTYAFGFALLFALQMLIFSLSLAYYER
jgi:hypothetical protein